MSEMHSMLELRKYVISPEKILEMPSEERSLMLWCGHIHNELVTLLGMYRAVANTPCNSATEREANVMQLMTVTKLIAGKLWEGWNLLRKGFFGTALSNEYQQLLDEDATNALALLGVYFGKENMLGKLRNSFSFHYDFDKLKALPEGWDTPPEELTFYVAPVPAISFFSISESIVTKSMYLQIGAGSMDEGVRKLWDDLSLVINPMIGLCLGIFLVMVKQHIGDHNQIDHVVVGVLDPPKREEIVAPFFVVP
jgi:hypothetical protein